MSILLLKLHSLFHEIKEMFHLYFSQYMIVTYRSRPIISNKKYDNKIVHKINILLFVVYFFVRILVIGIVNFFKILTKLLIVNDRGLIGVALSGIRIVIFLIPLSLSSLYLYLSGDVDPERLKFYQDLHSYRTTTAISDSQGNLIGAFQSPLLPPSKNITHTQRTGTLYVNGVPDVFWDILRAQDDKHLSFNYSETSLLDILLFKKKLYKGIDLTSLIRKPFSLLSSDKTSPAKVSLMNQIIENLYGLKYFNQQCSLSTDTNTKIRFFGYINNAFTTTCKKIEYLRAARHLFPYLARFNGLEFKRWSAMHTPILVSNHKTYGLRSAAASVFGTKVERLSEAQQALLATSYLYKIRFIALDSNLGAVTEEKDKQNQTWDRLYAHTISVVKKTYGDNQPNRAEKILASLKAMKLPSEANVPNGFAKHMQNLSLPQQQQYGDLIKRKTLFVRGFDELIGERLKTIYKNIGNSKVVTDIIITLPVMANISFTENIDAAMRNMIEKCRTCFNKLPGSPLNKNGALMKIIVTDEQGKIIRYYKKGQISRRSIAGIAKLPASILLASLGDTANTKYCNRGYKGLKNETGPFNYGIKECLSLNKKGHAFTFKNTFAVSQELPLFYGLTQQHSIPRDTLLSLYKDFNLKDTISLQGNTPFLDQLSYDLIFGEAKSTPQEVHKFTHKITQTLFNSEFETDPFSIDQFLVADFSNSVESYYSGSLGSANTIQPYLKLSSTKSELRKILRSPVYNQGGTLRSFQNIPGVQFLFAKSGTSVTDTQAIKEKWAVGALKVNGRKYTFLIFIGTDLNVENGLGKNISHRTLIYPIMNEIVKSLR